MVDCVLPLQNKNQLLKKAALYPPLSAGPVYDSMKRKAPAPAADRLCSGAASSCMCVFVRVGTYVVSECAWSQRHLTTSPVSGRLAESCWGRGTAAATIIICFDCCSGGGCAGSTAAAGCSHAVGWLLKFLGHSGTAGFVHQGWDGSSCANTIHCTCLRLQRPERL